MRSNNLSCLVVAGDDWHPGIVGLIASRLKEKFKLPSFAFAFSGEFGTGSGRSLSGVDLGRALRSAVDAGIAKRGGGHAMAAGATVARQQFDAFRAFMNDVLETSVTAARSVDALMVEGSLTARGATIDLDPAGGNGGAIRRRQSGTGSGISKSPHCRRQRRWGRPCQGAPTVGRWRTARRNRFSGDGIRPRSRIAGWPRTQLPHRRAARNEFLSRLRARRDPHCRHRRRWMGAPARAINF